MIRVFAWAEAVEGCACPGAGVTAGVLPGVDGLIAGGCVLAGTTVTAGTVAVWASKP